MYKSVWLLRYVISRGLLVLLILEAGCATMPPQPINSPASTPRVEALVSVLPTPNPNAGTVVGRLVSARDGSPLGGMVVFLERATASHTAPSVLYAPPNDQPKAMTDAQGQFVVSEVPDGEYVVVAYLPPADIHVITRPNSDQPALVITQPTTVIDIGTVKLPE